MCTRIKVKTSTFDTKLKNYRKIRILTTIDPFWDISFYLPNVLAKDQARYFLKLFPQKMKTFMAKNKMSQSLRKTINWIISNWIWVLEITIFLIETYNIKYKCLNRNNKSEKFNFWYKINRGISWLILLG